MTKQINGFLMLNLQFFAEDGKTEAHETNRDVQPSSETNLDAPETTEKTFTQSEVDNLVAKRLERERKKYVGHDELKSKVDNYATELESLREHIKQERINNEFTKLASSANIEYIDDAFALADLSMVSIDEKGKVVGMDDVVKALVENKPFLVAKKQKQPIGTATNEGLQSAEKTADQLLADAAEKARKSGLLKDKAHYAQLKKQLGK